jgi:tetratricopeptide (TPR) repeat protein
VPRRTDPQVELALRRAQRWIERGRAEKAIDLLEPLLSSARDQPDLHATLGYALRGVGDVQGAMSAFEEAAALSGAAEHLLPLATLYADAGLPIHALRILRRAIEGDVPTPFARDVRETIDALEEDRAEAARQLKRPVGEVEQGLYELEQGQRAMTENDFPAAIAANRRAIKRLGDWPPPYNNLSQALFYSGQPLEALSEVRGVLADHPDNVHALANGVRYLAWTGREEEARDLWARLKEAKPRAPNERLKKAEAAAILAQHDTACEILEPLEAEARAEELPPGLENRAQFILAVAEANLGRRRQAERRLRPLLDVAPLAAETLAGLKAGRSGTGWSDHFRYFHPMEMLPAQGMDELIALLPQEDEMEPERFQSRIGDFVRRFPQLVEVAERTIWEERQPEAGVGMLDAIGTPAAYAALRRFGLSQVGSDEARMEALGRLVEAGEIDESETVRVWLDGEWADLQLSLEMVPAEMMRQSDYALPVINALNAALTAQRQGEVERAEKLFQRVLELNPDAKEAYNNLGAIYAQRGEHERARAMLWKAISIDPLYVFPVCNLVGYLLSEGQIEDAKALVAPLSRAEGLYPSEIAFYNFTRARLLLAEEDFEGAEELLEITLDLQPNYEPAQEMLEWIQERAMWEDLLTGRSERSMSYFDEQQRRDRAWRARLQEKLSTRKPTLADAVPLYTKDGLTGMARQVMPWGGWSSLRKAELVSAIIEALTDRENLARIVEGLNRHERDALRTVLHHGGALVWEEFDACYDHDLGESRHWQWHTPETTMGQLRLHGLLVEALVGDELYIVIPVDLRESLRAILRKDEE